MLLAASGFFAARTMLYRGETVDIAINYSGLDSLAEDNVEVFLITISSISS